MTAEEEALLHTLETRVAQLALEYKALKERHAELERKMEEKEDAIHTLHMQAERLQADYANLKMAKIIEIGGGEMKDARSRLSKLVREVDKCIALLNV